MHEYLFMIEKIMMEIVGFISSSKCMKMYDGLNLELLQGSGPN